MHTWALTSRHNCHLADSNCQIPSIRDSISLSGCYYERQLCLGPTENSVLLFTTLQPALRLLELDFFLWIRLILFKMPDFRKGPRDNFLSHSYSSICSVSLRPWVYILSLAGLGWTLTLDAAALIVTEGFGIIFWCNTTFMCRRKTITFGSDVRLLL